jgi:hypothetical protein
VFDPRERAATGHIIGEIYYDSYWGGEYEVLAGHPDRSVSVRTVGEDRVRTHRTQLSYGSDHPVSERCNRHTACIQRQNAA